MDSHFLGALSHTFLLHFKPLPVQLLPYVLDIVFSIPFYSLILKRSSIFFSVLMLPQFLTSNPPSSIHYFSPLNPWPTPTWLYTAQHDDLRCLVPFLSLLSHSAQNTAYLLYQHQVYHALYLHSLADLWKFLCLNYVELLHPSSIFILSWNSKSTSYTSSHLQSICSGLPAPIIYTHFLLYP